MTEESRDVFDITFIGGGPVGLFGAFYAGIRECRSKIIDSLAELGGQLTALYPEKYIYDMPGFPKVLAKDLVKSMVDQGLWKDPAICLDEQCLKLDHDDAAGHYILTTNRGTHYSKTVILCAGIGSLQPTLLREDSVNALIDKGVYYVVRNPDQFAGQDVMIVGGGDSAMDWTLHIGPIAKSLTLVHRRDVFRAHEQSVRQVMESPINKRLFWVIEKAHGTDKLESVTIKNSKTGETETIPVDALILNIGFKSDIGPIKEWGLELTDSNDVIVDKQMQTNRPGIYAAGDIAHYDGKLKLIATGVGEVTMAVNQAKVRIDPNSKLFPGHSSEAEIR
ncbi:MAG: NAD(P)/FAD-dependent oxidoreductase [Candidatus Poribacteria bacterium]|nr:NAD(P)/FAD-dependent oxidoreductase [Candidatus Poribacteria bacterium]